VKRKNKIPIRKPALLTDPGKKAKKPGRLDLISGDRPGRLDRKESLVPDEEIENGLFIIR